MGTTTNPTVSVVIPTRGRRERLPRLLDGLETEPAAEIIVVVNGPPDGSWELLESRAAEDPRIKPFSIPVGRLAAALSRGAEEASSEVVLLLDDDVLPRPGLIEGHASHHAAKAGLVVVGYMPVDLPSPRRRGEYPIFLYDRTYETVCDGYERETAAILRDLWAGNISIRREDLLRVGPETPSLDHDHWYHQDLDFGLRCEAAGLTGVFDRALLARHDHRITPPAFLLNAREAGCSRRVLQSADPEGLGPLPADFYERGVPMPGRLLVRLSRRGYARAPIQFLLRGLTGIAGLLHLFQLESHAAYVMGKIEQQRGSLEAASEAGEGGETG